MNKVIRDLIILALFLLICPAFVLADIVYIKNGDKLFGTLQNLSFSIRTAYGKVSNEPSPQQAAGYQVGFAMLRR
jgi:hypothetical protein